jgi:hypothetical protein
MPLEQHLLARYRNLPMKISDCYDTRGEQAKLGEQRSIGRDGACSTLKTRDSASFGATLKALGRRGRGACHCATYQC